MKEAEFGIDNIYDVHGVGIVVGGVVKSGKINVGSKLLLGPMPETHEFMTVTISSVHIRRRHVSYAEAGQMASFSIPELTSVQQIRRGMVLIESPLTHNDNENHRLSNDLNDEKQDINLIPTNKMETETETDTEIKSNINTKINTELIKLPESCYCFEAEMDVLYGCNLRRGSQPVAHIGSTRQSIHILELKPRATLLSGESGFACLVFCHRPEYITIGQKIILR